MCEEQTVVAIMKWENGVLNFHGSLGFYERMGFIHEITLSLQLMLVEAHNWLVVSTSLKNMKVGWDYEIPNIWKNKSHVPNHQPDVG
jgi:hypothetical protein